MKYSILENCVEFEMLKANLTEDELIEANLLCEIHENSSPDEAGKYPCGCTNMDENGYSEFCNAGCWLEGNTETDDFIKLIKGEQKVLMNMDENEKIKKEMRDLLENLNVALTVDTGVYETEKERIEFMEICIQELSKLIDKIIE